ncbi:rRNA maturation RNAse YbeY [Candidatus Roizmanbacteria bacterium]|nr:rRNA maturation RNAse YbeY [Candidatus Roizmanbacteria bacterium]
MIEIFVQSRYQVDRRVIRKRVEFFLQKLSIDPAQYTVSIAIVGDRKMSQIHRRFAHKDGTTPVLSFPLSAGQLRLGEAIDKKHAQHVRETIGKDNPTLLGEIVVSYPQTLLFAADENKLVDVKIGEFIEHGLTKLLTTT